MSVCIQYIRYTIHYTLYSSRLHSALYTVYTSAESGGTRRTDPALHSEASSIRHTDRAAQPRASCRQANLAHPLVNPVAFSLVNSIAFSLVNSIAFSLVFPCFLSCELFFLSFFPGHSSSLVFPWPPEAEARGLQGDYRGQTPITRFWFPHSFPVFSPISRLRLFGHICAHVEHTGFKPTGQGCTGDKSVGDTVPLDSVGSIGGAGQSDW